MHTRGLSSCQRLLRSHQRRTVPVSVLPQTLYLQNIVDLPGWEPFLEALREVIPAVEHFETDWVEDEEDISLDWP